MRFKTHVLQDLSSPRRRFLLLCVAFHFRSLRSPSADLEVNLLNVTDCSLVRKGHEGQALRQLNRTKFNANFVKKDLVTRNRQGVCKISLRDR